MRALLVILCLSLAACRPPEANRSSGSSSPLSITITPPEAPRLGEATILVTVREGDALITDAVVEVTGDMTHAGMVPVISATELREDGSYQTTDFRFTMAGDWVLIAEVTLPSGERLQAERFLTVSGR